MDPERWPRVDALFEQALDLPPEERSEFLAQACGSDLELCRLVERLLAADAAAGTFLERPVLPDSLPAEAAEGRIGSYRLVRELGRGGMGVVYLAERDDRQFSRQAALKVIRGGSQRPDLLARFRAERQALASLEHPNIARLYDGGETAEGLPYLVMELVEGLPVDAYCDHHCLDVERRLRLMLQVCEAVQHAHRNLLVHRDLKPGNILVGADGVPKLLDFGIAKLLDEGGPAAQTQTGLRPMTPGYASPEQVAGGAITTASDVYSLGVLLYRLLAAASPYRLEEGSALALERAILEQEPERPSEALQRPPAEDGAADGVARARSTTPQELRRRLRGDLDTILLKALRKEPQRRYGSPLELATDLERHLADRPVEARPDSAAYRLGKFVRRNALGVAAGTLLALLLLAFWGVSVLQAGRIADERDVARRERTKAQQVSAFLLKLFENADPERRRGEQLTVREVLDQGAREIGELSDQPELQAAYMNSIGCAYRSLGLLDTAAGLLEAALELRRSVHGERHLDVAESLRELAVLRAGQGEFGEARELLERGLELERQLLAAGDRRRVSAASELAFVLFEQGDFDRAEAVSREALAEARLSGDPTSLADALNALALQVHARGDYEASEPLYRESLALRRQLHGDRHLAVSTALNNLATLLHDMGDYEAAEAHYEESLEIKRGRLGEASPSVIAARSNLASLAVDRGEMEVALGLYESILVSAREVWGDDHAHVAALETSLARVLLRRGEVRRAEQLARRGADLLARALPEGHWRTASARSVLGACLSTQGRYEEAEPLLLAAFPLLEREIGARESRTRYALEQLVAHFERRGMAEAAAQYAARAVE